MKRQMKLQLFAEAVKGKKIIYLYRIHELASTDVGTLIAFTTENSRSVSVDADSTVTKDGTLRTPSDAEIEITATSILSKGDPFIDKLETAMLDSKLMDIWEANLEEPAGTNKFKGKYYQGYLTEFEKSSNAEDFTEITLTFGINGKGAAGNVTVSTEQQEAANYVFSDSTLGLTASKSTSNITRNASASTTDEVTLTNIVESVKVTVTGDTNVISAECGKISEGGATLTITVAQGTAATVGSILVTDAAGYTANVAVTVTAPGA